MATKHALKQQLKSLLPLFKNRRTTASVVILVFAVVGLILLTSSRAATYVISLEAESGTVAGNSSKLNDASASNSQAVRFGGGTTPTPPTPPPPTPQPGTFTGPFKVSTNKRHLVDQNNKPFLVVADTSWTLLTSLSVENAKKYIDMRKAQGFNTILTNVVAFDRNASGPHGTPFQGGDMSKINESYFVALDQIIAHAAAQNMVLHIGTLWTGNNGGKWGGTLPPMNQFSAYGTFLGNRYKNIKNIYWFVGGDDTPYRNMSSITTLANSLKAADPNHLITYHTDSKAYDQSGSSWLDFNSIQWNSNSSPYTYADMRQGAGYNKPVWNMEPAYDPKACCGSDTDTSQHDNRRNGWWAILGGSLGVAYGGPQSTWGVGGSSLPTNDINRPAATHTGNINKILSPLNWHLLQPDWNNATVTGGRGSYGGTDYVTAGLASDGSLIVAYTPTARTLAVNMSKLSGAGTAQWYDPASGNAVGSPQSVSNSGNMNFSTPGNNAGGNQDWVLVIKR